MTRYRTNVIRQNLRWTDLPPDITKNPSAFVKRVHKHLARVLAESVTIHHDGFFSDMEIDLTAVDRILRENTSVLILAAHKGNWELLCRKLPRFTKHPVYGIYRPIKNEALDQIMQRHRSSDGLILVPASSIAKVIAKNHSQGINAIYILISDQNPPTASRLTWETFLGIDTAWVNGPARLASRYGMRAMYASMSTNGTALGSYAVKLKTIDMADIISGYVNDLDHDIREYPYDWLWTHKRWKRRREK